MVRAGWSLVKTSVSGEPRCTIAPHCSQITGLPSSTCSSWEVRVRLSKVASSASTSFQARRHPPNVASFSFCCTYTLRVNMLLRFSFSSACWFMCVSKCTLERGTFRSRSETAAACIWRECPSGPFGSRKEWVQMLRREITLASLAIAPTAKDITTAVGGEGTEFTTLTVRTDRTFPIW